jgi:hypothetical protein
MPAGRELRRRGLAGRAEEGLEDRTGGGRGDSVPEGVKMRSSAVESLPSDRVIHAVCLGVVDNACHQEWSPVRIGKGQRGGGHLCQLIGESGPVNHAIR